MTLEGLRSACSHALEQTLLGYITNWQEAGAPHPASLNHSMQTCSLFEQQAAYLQNNHKVVVNTEEAFWQCAIILNKKGEQNIHPQDGIESVPCREICLHKAVICPTFYCSFMLIYARTLALNSSPIIKERHHLCGHRDPAVRECQTESDRELSDVSKYRQEAHADHDV